MATESKSELSPLEQFLVRVFTYGMGTFALLLAVFLSLKPGPGAEVFGYALAALCAVSNLAAVLAVIVQICRHLRFTLLGLFGNLFALNLSLALWIGSSNAILKVIGMTGAAAWLVATSLWIFCKSVDAESKAKERKVE